MRAKIQILLTLIVLDATQKNAKKNNIRKYSFFILYHRISISIMVYVIELFIIIKNNAKQIKSIIDKKYKINFNYTTLFKI